MARRALGDGAIGAHPVRPIGQSHFRLVAAHILIIEDDPGLGQMLTLHFEDQGAEVRVVEGKSTIDGVSGTFEHEVDSGEGDGEKSIDIEFTDVDGAPGGENLGSVLYETLTLCRPFRGESHGGIMGEILTRPPVPPSEVQPLVPARLEAICLKALQKDPADRYRTAEALAQDLRGQIHGLVPAAVFLQAFHTPCRTPMQAYHA